MDRAALDALVADTGEFVGAAGDQVDRVAERVAAVAKAHPDAAAYGPGDIL